MSKRTQTIHPEDEDKTHNPGHISIVTNAANDRNGPKHIETRIPWP